jgi:hypothetical protein
MPYPGTEICFMIVFIFHVFAFKLLTSENDLNCRMSCEANTSPSAHQTPCILLNLSSIAIFTRDCYFSLSSATLTHSMPFQSLSLNPASYYTPICAQIVHVVPFLHVAQSKKLYVFFSLPCMSCALPSSSSLV